MEEHTLDKKPFAIAIDGPGGAGKSTVAKLLAKRLGCLYVDTGAMYRAVALSFMRHGVIPEDDEGMGAFLKDVQVQIRYQDGEQQVFLNGENVTGYLRAEEVGRLTSKVSTYPAVRQKLLELQRELARKENVVMDGRDITTHVLPNADLKIYLTASVDERAKRRYLELRAKGETCTPEEIRKDMEERDYRDSHREAAPLRQAPDAVLVDTSEMDVDQMVSHIICLWKEGAMRPD